MAFKVLSREEIEKLIGDLKEIDASEAEVHPEYLYGIIDGLTMLWAGVDTPSREFLGTNSTLGRVLRELQLARAANDLSQTEH